MNFEKENVMDALKKIFPLSFKFAKDVANLIIGIIIYVVIGAIAPIVLGILGFLPIIGWILGIVSSLVGIYCLAGIIIQVLVFCKVLK